MYTIVMIRISLQVYQATVIYQRWHCSGIVLSKQALLALSPHPHTCAHTHSHTHTHVSVPYRQQQQQQQVADTYL